jgi:hypothetical protein
MDMIIETIAIKTASSVLSKLITWGYKEITKSEFTEYEKELSKIIQLSINDYSRLYPIGETDKIPFYTSQALIEELFKFRFTGELSKEHVLKVIKSDDRIIIPTEDQLLKFFDIFNSKTNSSDKLKKLNIESNYKEEIFNVSETLKEAKDALLQAVNEIKSQISSIPVKSSLIEEWSNQLDEILQNLKSFKPYTAHERLLSLENRIQNAGFEADKKIFSRLYYMQAQCLGQMEELDISNKQATLFIKAYKFNEYNEDYKSNAALSYYVLGEKEIAGQFSEELLLKDEFNPIGWVIRCFLSEDNYRSVLQNLPQTVKSKKIFKLHLFHWLYHNKYISQINEFIDLGLGFDIDTSETPVVNYSNRHYLLITASYLLTKFYQESKQFSIALYFPKAKDNAEYIHANKILREVVKVIKGTEIEKNLHFYAFQFYCSSLAIDGDTKHIAEMEREFNKIKNKSIEVIVRMIQAYHNLNDLDALRKANQIIEDYKGEPNELLFLFGTINYSILNDAKKAEEFFIKYLDVNAVIDRFCLENTISLLRNSRFKKTDFLKHKFEELTASGRFSDESIKLIFQIALYVGLGIGFESENDFFEHLKKSESLIDPTDNGLSIHIAFGFVTINKLNEALAFVKPKIDFGHPSEMYKLYCKILFKIEGHKPELLGHLEKWRNNFYIDYELLEMELYFVQLQKNWKELIKIAKVGVEAYPNEEKFIYYLFHGLLEDGDIESIKAYSELVGDKDFEFEEYGIAVSMALLKGGLSKQSLELLYRQANNKQNIKARQSYITLSIQFPPELLTEYEVVEPGTFVKYAISDKKNIIPVTEENKGGFPESILLGKKVGEVFSIQKSVSGLLETGTILRVCNKYLALFEEILIDAENPLSGLPLQVIQFADSSVEGMNKALIENFGVQGTIEKERIEDQYEKYYSGKISFADITNSIFRRNFIDAYFMLSNPRGKLFKAISPAVSQNLLLTERTKFALDFTSVCLLYEISKELSLKYKQKFFISGLLRDEVVQRLEEEKISPRTELSISITKDHIQPHFYPENFKELRVEHFQSILNWIEENCEVQSVPERFNFIMTLKEEHKRDFFIQLLLENKLLGDRENYVLLTNDIFYYRTFGCPADSFISPLHYLDKYNAEKKKEISEFLLYHNYVGIYISAETLHDEVLKMLGGKENRFPICLENLRYSWNPYNLHVIESIKFVKSLYLLGLLNQDTRQQIVITVFSNLMVGLPIDIAKHIPRLIRTEFKLLPQHMIEVLNLLVQIVQM